MHPVASVDALELVNLDRSSDTSQRYRSNRLYFDESLGQSQSVACQQDRAGRRKRLHSLRDMRWDTVKAQVDEVFPLVLDGNNDRAGIDPDPDLKKHSKLAPNFGGLNARCLLHVERGVAGSYRVVFKRDGCPE